MAVILSQKASSDALSLGVTDDDVEGCFDEVDPSRIYSVKKVGLPEMFWTISNTHMSVHIKVTFSYKDIYDILIHRVEKPTKIEFDFFVGKDNI